MKIEKATSQYLQDIIVVNKFNDYENPDDFMRESVASGRVFVTIE